MVNEIYLYTIEAKQLYYKRVINIRELILTILAFR